MTKFTEDAKAMGLRPSGNDDGLTDLIDRLTNLTSTGDTVAGPFARLLSTDIIKNVEAWLDAERERKTDMLSVTGALAQLYSSIAASVVAWEIFPPPPRLIPRNVLELAQTVAVMTAGGERLAAMITQNLRLQAVERRNERKSHDPSPD